MFFWYNLIVILAMLLAAPYFLLRILGDGDYRLAWTEKLGRFSQDKKSRLRSRDNIWLHAVSVGEVAASLPLLELLKKNFPGRQLVISTTTVTGQRLARQRFQEAEFIYLPLDEKGVTSRVIGLIRPRIFIAAESEIWPNIFSGLKKAGVPIIVFNGRISDRSFRGYLKGKQFFKKIISEVDFWGMQTEEDRQRIIELGAPRERTAALGNTKFDARGEMSLSVLQAFRAGLGYRDGDEIMVAGSTHAGEEKIVLRVFSRLKKEFPGVFLIIAPRHPSRLPDIEKLVRKEGFSMRRRQETTASLSPPEVMLIDTIGELAAFYALARLVFVGGSLVPRGGQNPLEPARCGKAVLMGPHTFNFRGVVQRLIQAGALREVGNEEEFFREAERLLRETDLTEELGRRGREVVLAQAGAAGRYLKVVERYLDKNRGARGRAGC